MLSVFFARLALFSYGLQEKVYFFFCDIYNNLRNCELILSMGERMFWFKQQTWVYTSILELMTVFVCKFCLEFKNSFLLIRVTAILADVLVSSQYKSGQQLLHFTTEFFSVLWLSYAPFCCVLHVISVVYCRWVLLHYFRFLCRALRLVL